MKLLHILSAFNRSGRSPAAPLAKLAVVGVLLLFASLALWAAAPMAGTTIGNAASATYRDNANIERQVTSNVVVTIVQQVYSFDLVANRAAVVAPGGQVFFPHTVTNTGNGQDTYRLSLANDGGDNFDLTNLRAYADVNQDGIPDDTVDLTASGGVAIPLGPNGSYHFVVVGTAPGSVTGGQVATITVTATADAGGQTPRTNTDTVTVTANAVIAVTKAISRNSGPSPADTAASNADQLTYTLTYTNTGNTAATNLTLTDVIPTGLIYVDSSGSWSGSGTALTDATGETATGITYDYNITASNRVTAVIATVNPGASGTLSFRVRVTPGISAQAINNTALYRYDPGTGTPTSDTPTNTVPYTVTQFASVWLGANASTMGEVAPGTDVAFPGLNGVISSASPGSTITFVNRVYNKGNGTDTFDITLLAGNTFPAGTSFLLYKSDGNTPLVDTNGNGTPDTGPLAVDGTYDVVVKATLPTNAAPGVSNRDVTLQAASTVDATKTNTTVNRLQAITALSVDLTNDTAAPGASNGTGTFDPSTRIRTNTPVSPGQVTTFILVATNTSSTTPDTYDLTFGSDQNVTAPLPSGWTVVFKDQATGQVITNTGVVQPGASKAVIAEVTPPASTTPGTTDVYFKILSPTTGAGDSIRDAVEVVAVRSLEIAPNNSGQTYPGGSVVYTHTLKNNSNVREGEAPVSGGAGGSSIALSLGNSLGGWTAVTYYDANDNGELDASDPVVADLSFTSAGTPGLDPGESVRLFTKVFSPPGAPSLAANVTTLTATAANGSGAGAYSTLAPGAVSATDTTTIVLGDLSITKTQVLDANCDGAETGYAAATIPAAAPGACIKYRIVVTNTGSASSTNIEVYDVVPNYTTYSATPVAAVSGGSAPAVDVSALPNIKFTIGALAPGESATCTFAVRIDTL